MVGGVWPASSWDESANWVPGTEHELWLTATGSFVCVWLLIDLSTRPYHAIFKNLYPKHTYSCDSIRIFSFLSPWQTICQEWCRNWPTKPLIQRFPGWIIRRLSSCTRVPHTENKSVGGPSLFSDGTQKRWGKDKASPELTRPTICHFSDLFTVMVKLPDFKILFLH